MPIETANYISELVPTNPLGSDPRSSAAAHLRMLKRVVQTQFSNLGAAAVTRTAAQLNQVGVTQALGDNTTAPASTAFVQAAIAAVNAASGAITWSISSAGSVPVGAGQGVLGTNAGQIIFILPVSPVLYQRAAVSPCNGRFDNLVAFNGNKHMNVSDATMTIGIPDATVEFVWTGAAYGWKLV